MGKRMSLLLNGYSFAFSMAGSAWTHRQHCALYNSNWVHCSSFPGASSDEWPYSSAHSSAYSLAWERQDFCIVLVFWCLFVDRGISDWSIVGWVYIMPRAGPGRIAVDNPRNIPGRMGLSMQQAVDSFHQLARL